MGVRSSDGRESDRVADREARIAELEATRDRLLAERRDIVSRYELLLREERHRTRRSERPDDDGVVLRIARILGLR